MRVFKLRQILHQRGLLLERNRGSAQCWIVTNNGTVKSLIHHEFDTLDAVEAWVAQLPNRLTAEESDLFDKDFTDFIEAEGHCGRTVHFLHVHQIVEGWPKWKRSITMLMDKGCGKAI